MDRPTRRAERGDVDMHGVYKGESKESLLWALASFY